MRFQLFAIWLLLFYGARCHVDGQTVDSWTARAMGFAQNIEAEEDRGHAYYKLTYVAARAGDFERALACARNVNAPQTRIYAFAFTSRQAAIRERVDIVKQALLAIKQAAGNANGVYGTATVVDLLCEAKQYSQALAYASKVDNSVYRHTAFERIAELLGKAGDIKQAMFVVANHLSKRTHDHAYGAIMRAMADLDADSNFATAEFATLLSRFTSKAAADKALVVSATRLSKQGEAELAESVASRISDKSQRTEVLADITAEARGFDEAGHARRFQYAKRRSVRIHFGQGLVQHYVKQGRFKDAESWIAKTVEAIKSDPQEPQSSQFGTFDDQALIAQTQALHLDIALGYGKDSANKAARHLELAESAIAKIGNSFARTLLQPKLFQAYTELGMDDRLDEIQSLATDGYFDQLSFIMSLEARLRAKRDGVFHQLEKIQPGQGIGNAVSEIVRELIRQDEIDRALELTARLQSSEDISYAYESLGSELYSQNGQEGVYAVLAKLKGNVGLAHVCIGVADHIAKLR